jgi:putative hydrolase of the HAD superfamily
MTIRGVGFDLGDTLLFYRDTPLNWTALYPKALARVAAAGGAKPTPEEFAAAGEILKRYNTRLVPRAHEVTAAEILWGVLQAWNVTDHLRLPPAIEAFFTFFQQRMDVYPDTIPTLNWLRQSGISMGILTDVPYGMPRAFVMHDLENAGISSLIDTVITSVEVGFRKAEPAGYLALTSRLQLAPGEMLYVGNEAKDVIGAVRSGMGAVFLDRDGTGASHGQQYTISTLSGIRDLFPGIGSQG